MTKEQIIKDYINSEIDRMEAIEALQKIGYNSHEAEAIIEQIDDR